MNGYVPWTNFNNTLARLGQYAGFKQRQRQQEAENKRADAYLNLAQIREERDKQRYDDEQAMLPYRYMQVKYDALQKILPSVTKENYRQIYPWLVQDNIHGRGGLPTFSVPSVEQVEDPSFNFDEWKNKFGLTAEQRANMEVKSLERDLERDKLAFGREELGVKREILAKERSDRLSGDDKTITVSPGQTVIDRTGKVIYESPNKTAEFKPITVSPGQSVIDQNGNEIFSLPSNASGEKRYTLGPNQTLVDASGKEIAKGPEKEDEEKWSAPKNGTDDDGRPVVYQVSKNGKVRILKGVQPTPQKGMKVYDSNGNLILDTGGGEKTLPAQQVSQQSEFKAYTDTMNDIESMINKGKADTGPLEFVRKRIDNWGIMPDKERIKLRTLVARLPGLMYAMRGKQLSDKELQVALEMIPSMSLDDVAFAETAKQFLDYVKKVSSEKKKAFKEYGYKVPEEKIIKSSMDDFWK